VVVKIIGRKGRRKYSLKPKWWLKSLEESEEENIL